MVSRVPGGGARFLGAPQVHPHGTAGHSADIANACLFYASDESSYITGDRMNVVGGRYIV